MRTSYQHTTIHIEDFKQHLLIWSQQFDDVVWLDSNNDKQAYSTYDAVLAVDAFTSIQTDYIQGFEDLKSYQTQTNDWIFGYLTYDLKNDIESLKSSNYDGLGFPIYIFFQPKKLFLITGNQVEIQYLKAVDDDFEADLKAIQNVESTTVEIKETPIKIKLRTRKDVYFKKLKNILNAIHLGNIYEVNFCQEFYAEQTIINPLETYNKLNAISNAPFAAFFKCQDKYVLSASPTVFKKEDATIISQPIKGTAKRSNDGQEDLALKKGLLNDEKERSENIMIVDLVRNDLSKTALKGSVTVEELCQVYSFSQVHQMISTIRSTVDKTTHPVDIIKSTFPMGSMTGAPKISAMKIIENQEDSKRGVYSGAVGYFSPTGDFDFNVVIRSILYNETKKYVSYSVGGAITAKSDPTKEYEECLIKAKAMRTVLEE